MRGPPAGVEEEVAEVEVGDVADQRRACASGGIAESATYASS